MTRRLAAAAALFATLCGTAQAGDPLKIGFSMALTGGLAANGKAALEAMKIWAEDQNAKGGLLGRKIDLVYYDDQTNPAQVPAIYTKLLDVDHVDLVVSSYGTNLIVPAMPIIMQRGLTFPTLLGLGANDEFNYGSFFGVVPFGVDAKHNISAGFLAAAMAQTPKPTTIAIVAADAEFSKKAGDGARDAAKQLGLKIVYDRSYPPNTVDFTAIMRGVQASSPDIVFVGAYPPDGAGIIRAAREIGLKTKMFGGGIVGLQFSALKTQLGPRLNGVTNYDFWVPSPKMNFAGLSDFLVKYQARAAAAGVDPLGYYAPPFAYAMMQVLGAAVEATGGTDHKKLSAWLHANEMNTIVGKFRFSPNGEWSEPRVLQVQFQGIKGDGIEQFRGMSTQIIISPDAYASGKLIYPYTDAVQ